MATERYRNVFLPNELFCSSSDVVCADGNFESASKFPHQHLYNPQTQQRWPIAFWRLTTPIGVVPHR